MQVAFFGVACAFVPDIREFVVFSDAFLKFGHEHFVMFEGFDVFA